MAKLIQPDPENFQKQRFYLYDTDWAFFISALHLSGTISSPESYFGKRIVTAWMTGLLLKIACFPLFHRVMEIT